MASLSTPNSIDPRISASFRRRPSPLIQRISEGASPDNLCVSIDGLLFIAEQSRDPFLYP